MSDEIRRALTDVLERMVSGQTSVHELERLLPWSWQAEPYLEDIG